MKIERHEALAYSYLLLNQIGTYTSYLAVVALSQGQKAALFNLSILFTARHLGGAIAFRQAANLITFIGERNSLILGNFIAALGMFLIAFVSKFIWPCCAVLALVGFLDNLLVSGFHSYNGKELHRERLLRVNHNLQVIEYFTAVVGATIGGSLIQYVSLKSAFIFDSLSFALCGMLIWILSNSGTNRSASAHLDDGGHIRNDQKSIMPKDLKLLMLLEVLIALLIGTFNFVEIPYYTSILGLSYSMIGPFFVVSIAGSSLAGTYLNRWKNTEHHLSSICIFTLLASATFLALGLTSHVITAAFLVLANTGLLSLVAAASVYTIQTQDGPILTPHVMTIRIAIKKTVFILLTPVLGVLSEKYGLLPLMVVTAGVFVGMGATFLLSLRIGREGRVPAE